MKYIFVFLFSTIVFAKTDMQYVVNQLEDSSKVTRALTLDFVQIYETKNKILKHHGQAYISRPHKMMFQYMEPKGKFFLTDGLKISVYDPDLNQVVQTPQPKKENFPIGFALLFGQEKITELFGVVLESEDSHNMYQLLLTPKTSVPNVKKIQLWVSKTKPMYIQKTKIYDDFDQVQVLEFSNVKVNAKIDRAVFKFKKPKGATVVDGQSFSFGQ